VPVRDPRADEEAGFVRGFLHSTAPAGIEEKPNGNSRAGIGTEHRSSARAAGREPVHESATGGRSGPVHEPSHAAAPLTSRTSVLLLTSHDDPSPERPGRSGVPPGPLGWGSSALGRCSPRPSPTWASRGRGGAGNSAVAERRSGGAAGPAGPAGHVGPAEPAGRAKQTEWSPGHAGSGDTHRLSRPGCDPRVGRFAARRDHRLPRRWNQRQDDARAAGGGSDPGRRRDRGVPGPGREPGSGRGCDSGRPARLAGRSDAGFAGGGAGHGSDAPPGSNRRPAAAGPPVQVYGGSRDSGIETGGSIRPTGCDVPSSRRAVARSGAAEPSFRPGGCSQSGRCAEAGAEPSSVDSTRARRGRAANRGSRGKGSVRAAWPGGGAANPLRGGRAAGCLPGEGRVSARGFGGCSPPSRIGRGDAPAPGRSRSARGRRAGRSITSRPISAAPGPSSAISGLRRCDSSISTGPTFSFA
jgi:hypothetical protein